MVATQGGRTIDKGYLLMAVRKGHRDDEENIGRR